MVRRDEERYDLDGGTLGPLEILGVIAQGGGVEEGLSSMSAGRA